MLFYKTQRMIIASKNGSMVSYARILSQKYKVKSNARICGTLRYNFIPKYDIRKF